MEASAMHVLGTDVGENSLGLASIEVDENGSPAAVNRLMVVLHDNGRDGMASGSGGSVSRKASGGSARRVRRLYRNRRRRSIELEKRLRQLGYPVVAPEPLQTYEEWRSRQELLREHIKDDDSRRSLLSIAIRHMSNHRGWANAWVSLDTYLWKEEPSPEFKQAVEDLVASERFDFATAPQEIHYQADLAAFGLRQDERLRPRQPQRPGPDAVPPEQAHLLGSQRRVDVVREWRQICRVQQVPDDHFEQLARIAFSQEKPSIPAERVGNDWLPGFKNRKRASRASLEHQEFQIRQTVANLRIRENGAKRRLTVEEQKRVVDHLFAVTSKNDAPTWKDISEEVLQVSPRSLVTADRDQSVGSVAPTLRSVATVNTLPKRHPIRQWWDTANDQDRRDFIRWIADPVKLKRPARIESQIEPILEALNDKQAEAVQRLTFPSGRDAHCVDALDLMNAEIERTGKSYVEVRNYLFDLDEQKNAPTPSTLDVVADHPTLQRILPPMRRFLQGIVSKHGEPERVVIEHVRSAFQGFQAREDALSEQRRNQRDRERAAEHIRHAYGISEPSNHMIRRVQAFERQGSRCLYCGSTPGFGDIELDHIVPRKTGGNSTRANLVAVCRACNAAKGKRTFVAFAATSQREGVSLEAALQRIDELQQGQLDRRAFSRLKREMRRRLKQDEFDDPIDERSLASTAYAAVDIRERIQGTLSLGTGEVPVYSGRIIQAARKASGIDRVIRIREGVHAKSRFDRRHHAIDAAVAAMINPSVARTLAERDDMRRAAYESNEDRWNWTTYEGSTPEAVRKFCKWKEDMQELARLVDEVLKHDDVVVTYPVRFSAKHAALHEAGRSPHRTKAVGEAWTSGERARIVDGRVYEALSKDLIPSAPLHEDESRTLTLPSGMRLDGKGEVYLYPDAKARMPLPNKSSAPLGQSMHHVRLYRWLTPKGEVKAGVVRVWAADLYELEDGIEGDLLTSPLSGTSQAVRRTANARLRDAIHQNAAEHVGTFVIGDELLIDPYEWRGANETGRFMDEWPERHWRLSGWEQLGVANIKPVLLSEEGIRKKAEDTSDRLVDVSTLTKKVLKASLRITASQLWSTPSTQVIRRTATGEPRQNISSGLPTSWSPIKAVYGE
ncbi:type II CRISPR RNA-guided endonuclease Cas9 [Gulosibacter sp. 10]|uniref:type II CRISPR RNA-guided endonuclease Cas9 n=1 Tax=Gulosibacter sp. 10 TaxID=1255570 RepID=UPI000B34CCF5|nr:type II CRISPR RNA-guided endonuclease Cas9 [Gulosibacter sp. 10]